MLRRTAPDLAVDLMGSGRVVLTGPFAFLRAAGATALALGAVTLGMAMLGRFGIQSHIAGCRTREIGVRMFCGATATQIRQMVLRDAYCPVSKGWCSAWSAAWPAARSFGRTWVDAAIVDPWVVLLVPIPLVLAAFCACYLPASRAENVDPNVALRQRRRIERDRQWSV